MTVKKFTASQHKYRFSFGACCCFMRGKCKFWYVWFISFGFNGCLLIVLLWYPIENLELVSDESRTRSILQMSGEKKSPWYKKGIVSSSFMLIFMCFRCVHFSPIAFRQFIMFIFCLQLKSLTFQPIDRNFFSCNHMCEQKDKHRCCWCYCCELHCERSSNIV